jgi:hypothetical protein
MLQIVISVPRKIHRFQEDTQVLENGGPSLTLREAQFMQLISMFQIAALQQMGKLPNPMTNEIEQDLEQAKGSIDFIEMIKEKTKGNLSDKENEFLDKVLFELHMNYVDEAEKKAKVEEDGDKDEGSGETPEEGDSPERAQPPQSGSGGKRAKSEPEEEEKKE